MSCVLCRKKIETSPHGISPHDQFSHHLERNHMAPGYCWCAKDEAMISFDVYRINDQGMADESWHWWSKYLGHIVDYTNSPRKGFPPDFIDRDSKRTVLAFTQSDVYSLLEHENNSSHCEPKHRIIENGIQIHKCKREPAPQLLTLQEELMRNFEELYTP